MADEYDDDDDQEEDSLHVHFRSDEDEDEDDNDAKYDTGDIMTTTERSTIVYQAPEEEHQERLAEQDNEPLEMALYTADDLLRKTVRSEVTRGKAVPAKASEMAEDVRRGPQRVWEPEGEYELIRAGPPLSHDPDRCPELLQERTLTLFKNIDPTVEFGKDPARPLWKGVFAMRDDLGYEPGQYYAPKQVHLRQIYAKSRPKDKRPVDNIFQNRNPTVQHPYWVDDWYHVKMSEEKHKAKSRSRKRSKNPDEAGTTTMSSSVAVAAGPGPKKAKPAGVGKVAQAVAAAAGTTKKKEVTAVSTENLPPVAPLHPGVVFQLGGWLRDQAYKKKPAAGDEGIVSLNATLKPSPANALAKETRTMMEQLYKTPLTGAAVLAAATARVPPPHAGVVAAHPPPPPAKKRERPEAPFVEGENPLTKCSKVIRDTLSAFALNSEDRVCKEWREEHWGKEKTDLFYSPGEPGEFAPALAKQLVKVIMSEFVGE